MVLLEKKETQSSPASFLPLLDNDAFKWPGLFFLSFHSTETRQLFVIVFYYFFLHHLVLVMRPLSIHVSFFFFYWDLLACEEKLVTIEMGNCRFSCARKIF
jgi:hypothetical protein